jgi:ADP-heptose:LPS heptosyltransferase
VKFIYKKAAQKLDKNMRISKNDIENSKTILFSVFTRYGDGIIAFVIIKEFISKYKNKNYILITTPQHYSYAKELFEEFSNIEIKYFNKKNPFSLFSLTRYLKNKKIDLGFNPWSFGEDSEYFILFAKKYSSYKHFRSHTKIDNLYNRIREYFYLNIKKEKKTINFKIDKNMKVLIAPFSTDFVKNLSIKNIEFLQSYFKNNILAIPKNEVKKFKNSNLFIFGKSQKYSQEFIQLLKKVDLFIGVDSGPLHIALALNKKCIAIFGPTAPSVVLNDNHKIKIIRDKRLEGIFCCQKCNKAKCIYDIINEKMFNIDYKMKNKVILDDGEICPLEKKVNL